jgi:hypothetical protein
MTFGKTNAPDTDREPPRGGLPPRRSVSRSLLAVVAVVAAAIGITVALLLQHGSGLAAAGSPASSPAAVAPSAGGVPSSGTQGGSSGGLPALPALSGNGDGKIHLMLAGQVLAVSGTSITIGGNGPAVTAAISSATQVTGKVSSISGIKVGDTISAQLSGTSTADMTATAIQDPVSTP